MEVRKKVEVINTVTEAFFVTMESFLPALSAGGVVILTLLGMFAISALAGSAALAVVTVTVFYLALVPALCAVTLVAQACAMRVEVPVAPFVLFTRLQFWKYVGAYLLCNAISIGAMLVAFLPALFMWSALGIPADSPVLMGALGFGGFVGVMAMILVGLRLCLVTPAIAAGHPFSLASSWNLMGGNVLRFLCVAALCSLPASVMQALVEAAVKSSEGVTAAILGGIAVLLVAFVQCLLLGAAGGIFYRRLALEQ